MSASGQKRPFMTLPPEWPLSGVKRTFKLLGTRKSDRQLTANSGQSSDTKTARIEALFTAKPSPIPERFQGEVDTLV
jgi:hypothetical protein